MIPREVLFGNPDRARPELSPDGTRIAYLAPVDGVLNVWVGPADNPSAATPVTHDTGRGIRFYGWPYTNNHISYIQDMEGDENWRVYSVDLTSGRTLDLTPVEGVQARIQHASPRIPDEVLVGLNDRDPRFHDLYRVNLRTGKWSLIQQNQEFTSFVTDDEYNVRFAFRVTPEGGGELLKPGTGGAWESFIKVDMEDTLTTSPFGFDKTGNILYMSDSRGRDTAALRAIYLDTMVHPTEKHIQAAAFNFERKHWQVLDNSIAPDLEYLRTVADGEIDVVSSTLDDTHWIVAFLVDDGPVRFYRYSRQDKKADFLFTNRREVEGLPLAKMRPPVIKSRDGLDLVCYYTLPAWSDSNGDGVPDRPLPLVLDVHGSPWSRDEWGYKPWNQCLANRGYVAMNVNFRGSTGFGKKFINAANFEWGGKMHDDLIDAVRWAIAAGIADPERVAITGGSYGGYAALIGMTSTPDIFACGVDIVGPSNLITLIESIPPYWEPIVAMFTSRVGDHRSEEGRAFLSDRSPLSYVERIERPLLIGQGANDPRVKQRESDQIVRAMEEKDIPVTYVLYQDQGHGFARPENRLSFFAVAEAFLSQWLGGRFLPIGRDFDGSSITVPTGAGYVPGLAETLRKD